MTSQRYVTELLSAWGNGDAAALDELVPLIYTELHRIAEGYLRKERPNHTLQSTALVHEAYIRLIDTKNIHWRDRVHFFGAAARAMRRILVDHARRHQAAKRGGGSVYRVTLNEAVASSEGRDDVSLLALDDSLNKLAAMDEQKSRIVELRYFSGLSNKETAEVLGIPESTVASQWRTAKAWLHRELSKE